METIKKCPFCGSSNIRIDDVVWGMYWAVCLECGAKSGDKASRKKAIEAWNRRADDDRE